MYSMNSGKDWYLLPPAEIERLLGSDTASGLSDKEAAERLKKYGKNDFGEARKDHLPRIFLRQLENPLVLILFAAGVATFFLGARIDTIVIFAALAINIGIGMFQEGRSSVAFEKLKLLQEKRAVVLRGGMKREIRAEKLVPGDIVHLESGQAVPADIRLIEANNLLIDESLLTGEWVPVSKEPEAFRVSPGMAKPIAEQGNMAWMGTLVAGGIGKGVVVETGPRTQAGLIAESLRESHAGETPLQKAIKRLAHTISIVIIVIIVALAALGVYRGEGIWEMFFVAVAVAVAAIPEGLPAAVTVVLALGMEAILKRKGLVRNLLAAETLGSTTVILTDKTGTLTEARMSVATVVTANEAATRTYRIDDAPLLPPGSARAVLEYAILAADAFIEPGTPGKDIVHIKGRPVERAVVHAGLLSGVSQDALKKMYVQKDFLPFDSARRFSAVLLRKNEAPLSRMVIVGAPEVFFDAIASLGDTVSRTPNKDDIAALQEFQDKASAQGLRLVAVAYKDTHCKTLREELTDVGKPRLENIVFSGFVVLHDPLRSGVKDAVSAARRAGIRVVMLTGDHQSTARAVADAVGIAKRTEEALVGSDIDALSDAELFERLKTVNVLARVLPEQKLRIARVLKAHGEVVAMTGDGVNDAPALRSADIGVSLGSGTDVAKEASALVLLDDSFAIIVHAIEEGRRIIDNLKKIISYLLGTGFSEIVVIAGALALALPLPLLPAQILWINIIEEGFMNFAFAFEPKEEGLMRRGPKGGGSAVLTSDVKKLVFILAGVTGAILTGLYFFLSRTALPEEEIRTIMFIALAVDSIFFAFSLKNFREPLWRIPMFSNGYLIFALGVSVAALLAALYVPALRELLSLTPPSRINTLFFVGFGFLNLFIIECAKYFVFRRNNNFPGA